MKNLVELIPYSGKNLELKRKALNLSRKELGLLAGIGESTVYHYEKELKKPTAEALSSIGLAMSKQAGTRIIFTSEWDKRVIEEYEAPNFGAS